MSLQVTDASDDTLTQQVKGTSGAAHVYVTSLFAGENQTLNVQETINGANEYETVAAGVTAQALGSVGVVGDYLKHLVCVVSTAATAQVQIKDGADSAITVFPNSPGGGIGTYIVPLGLLSRTGAWQVTTAAGVAVVAVGLFS